jgi:signal transduction histidine kinase/ligand-binding sensor domain-containing protein/DNA-binding response OmpR family regulator
MAKFYKIIFLLCFLPVLVSAQYDNPSINSPKGQAPSGRAGQSVRFEHLTSEDGLSYSVIKCFIQDHKGMIWIGTGNGLNKYDGNKFKVYRNIPGDSTSISYNWINRLYEDSAGQLWIGLISGGLCRYNREMDNFVRYVPIKDDTTSLKGRRVNAIYEFKDGNQSTLWIGTVGAINKFNPETNNFKHYYPEGKKRRYKTNNNFLGTIVHDGSNRLWISTWREGLFYYDAVGDRFVRYQPSKNFKIKFVLSLYATKEQGKDILWAGTYIDGLYKIEIESGKVKQFLHEKESAGDETKNSIFAIYPDTDLPGADLWLGSYNGLYRFNTINETYFNYKYDVGHSESLNSDFIEAVYKDKSGLVWIGTDRGVNKLNPLFSNFHNLGQNNTSQNNLSNNTVTAICGTEISGRKTLWIGTSNGLKKYDPKTGQISYIINDPNSVSSLSNNYIMSILYSNNFLWIGTNNGLNRINPITCKIKRYFIPDTDPAANQIYTLAEDEAGVIWMGTLGSPIYSFDPKNEKFSRHIGYSSVYSLFFDSFGYLWTGLQAGLRRINLNSKKSTWYWHNSKDESTISHNEISAILESKNKTLWIGTAAGLNKYNRETESFIRYTDKDGLPSNLICAILEDDHGNLWISTSKGISKFNPENITFKNFDAGDGLQGNEFKYLSAYKNKRGEMFFGGTNGLTMFHPDRIKNNTFIPPVVLTDFQIFNKNIRPGENSILKNNITETKEILIPYDQSVFSFEFAALDYFNPKKNQYAYQMEGIDPNWVYIDASRRFATYTNLDAGEYTFRVKGSNNDGLWNEEGTSVKVIILPPWWKTNWAYTFYLIFFGFVVYGVWRFQTNRLKMKQQMEMKNFEADKLREVDKMKSHFFANISHEFRTPLTLIKGPVKQMLDEKFVGNIKEQYKMILRNSDRLLGLINQILDLSKLESGEMKLKVSKTDIIKYLKGLVQSFSSFAERKKISLKFDNKIKILMGYIDHDKLEKIITNLLSNAFKFTPESGVVEVAVLTTPLPAASPFSKGGTRGVQISISNTGTGIPADQIEKIFDRFYQVDDNYKKDSEGSGIGLALTKELVEVCHGEISISSIPNKTTTFFVTLPIAKEFFKEDEIVVSTPQISPFTKGGLRGVAEYYSESEKIEQKSIAQKIAPLILIVEDNPDVTGYIRSFMENGYRILTAENGKEGLKKTIEKYPDLVISDVMMPEMDGFELCQKIKSDERISHIPVILLTAKADLISKLEGLEFGADDYINKPFEADELKVRSKNLIEQRKRLREKFARLAELQPNEIAVTSTDEKFLERLMTVFEDYISDPEFSTEKCAREVGMSRMSLNNKLKALTNKSTHEFIRTLRLKRAAQLLKNATGSVAEVAYSVGFNNTSHFAKAFRQQFGQSPSTFANKKNR